MDILDQSYTHLWWILYILSNCPPESLCIFVYFTHFLAHLGLCLIFLLLLFFLIFFCPQHFLIKSYSLCFLRKGREDHGDWKYDFIQPAFMTSRNVANLIQDPAVPSWCLLTGDYSPTVLLSKFKLCGSAKEKCHHYGKITGWRILLEWARHWSMTETVWCVRSRLAWSDGGFLFFGGFFCLVFFSWLFPVPKMCYD